MAAADGRRIAVAANGPVHLVTAGPALNDAPDSTEAEEAIESPFAPSDVTGVLRPPGEATMLPARAYTDPAVLQFERDRWFGVDWVCVGRASDVAGAGTWFVAAVGGASVIVMSGDDGVVRAFHNVCRHRGVSLLGGCGARAASVRCPYHAWTYDLRGRLAHAPGIERTGGLDPDRYDLRRVRLEAYGGFLFVSLAPGGARLLDWLGDLPAQFDGIPLDDLHLGRRVRHTVRANWKLLMENFAEAYHFAPVHPQLEQKTPSRDAESLLSLGPWQGGWMPLRPGTETVSVDGRRHGRPLLRKRGAEAHGALDYLLFPNLFLSLHPDYLLAYRLVPLSHDHTEVTVDFLFDPGASRDGVVDAPDVYDFWELTNAQDLAMCERQQTGIASSGYTPGTYTAFEEGVHEFDKIVAERYADP